MKDERTVMLYLSCLFIRQLEAALIDTRSNLSQHLMSSGGEIGETAGRSVRAEIVQSKAKACRSAKAVAVLLDVLYGVQLVDPVKHRPQPSLPRRELLQDTSLPRCQNGLIRLSIWDRIISKQSAERGISNERPTVLGTGKGEERNCL